MAVEAVQAVDQALQVRPLCIGLDADRQPPVVHGHLVQPLGRRCRRPVPEASQHVAVCRGLDDLFRRGLKCRFDQRSLDQLSGAGALAVDEGKQDR